MAGWVSPFCWHTVRKPFYGWWPRCSPCPRSHLVKYVFTYWVKREISTSTWDMWCVFTVFNLTEPPVLIFFPLLSPHRDLLRIGVTLAGHQKKILGSIQDMRLQMNQTLPVQVWTTGHTDRCSRRTARQEKWGRNCARESHWKTLAAWPISAT